MIFKRRITWILGLFLALLFLNAHLANADRIYLHDGTSITGQIIESVPGGSFTLKKPDESVHLFKMDEVWKVKFEEDGLYQDKLYLKDGSIIIGNIIGAIPSETYKLKTEDESILVFKMDEVEKIEFQKAKLPVTPVPTPEAPPVAKQPSPVQPSVSEVSEEKGLAGVIGVNLNYPGLGVKVGVGRRLLLEPRVQIGSKASAYGLRGYYYFDPRDRLSLFAGVEGDIISFEGEVSEGGGFCGVGFVGGEYSLSERFSFQLDLGGAYINIEDDESGLSKSGLDYLVNIGLNLYFRKKVR